MFKFFYLLMLVNIPATLCSSIIDYSSTKMISINESDTYFGYSILLQRGNPPTAIIGAPRKKHGSENTGSVYKCDLNTLRCAEYIQILRSKGIYPRNKNGDFLGSVLVGDDISGGTFFTCAPRFIIEPNPGDYYTNGRCFYVKNSKNVNEYAKLFLPLNSESQVSVDKRIPYYNAAFGEVGFDMAYSKDQNMLLMGAPGKAQWNGALVKTNIDNFKNDVFPLHSDLFKFQDSYFGYAVSWGKFTGNSQQIWYLIGGPRGSDLRGHVFLFEPNGRVVKEQLLGEEYGSYFGASLLVIRNNGKGDDIMVGAPMYSGNTWDEGCVYYYKNNGQATGTFHSPIKLRNGKTASRFGTTMAEIGDIDLDSYTDCAISAPYEDDGIGAVYLFFGTSKGFSNEKYHRISPSHFSASYPKALIKGFGMGISNGNDIDNNKHNDIVIGAYQSGQVFYFKTNQMFDVILNLKSDTNILYTSTTNFTLEYCLMFKYRNGDRSKDVHFSVRLLIEDDRVLSEKKITHNFISKATENFCNHRVVFLKKNHLNIEPLIISYGYKVKDSSDQISENFLTIPVSYECGTDNVCQTNLSIKSTTFDPPTIIVGVNNELKVNVVVDNFGESAYQTKLYIKVPAEISLINLRECDFENGSYVCLVAQVLNGKIDKSFLFDLTNIQPRRTILPIRFKVESIGRDLDPSNNELRMQIPVVLQNSPHIDSRALPESVFLNTSEKILKITHLFLVGNLGPSPLDLNLTVLVPELKLNGSSVFEIQSIEGTVNGISSFCNYSKNTFSNVPLLGKLQNLNDTQSVSCIESSEDCMSIVCTSGYFPKSNKNAVFLLKINFETAKLENFFKEKNTLRFITSGYIFNGTKQFFTSSATLISSASENTALPLWVYIISVVSGLVLLLLLIFVLYKCNFFKRTYKELRETGELEQKEENEQNDDAKEDAEL